MTLARGEKTFSSSPSQPLQLQLVPLSPLRAYFCFIHEHFFFFFSMLPTMMPRCDWQINVGTQTIRKKKKH